MAGIPEIIELTDEEDSEVRDSSLKNPGREKEILIDLSSDDQTEAGTDAVSGKDVPKAKKNMTANMNLEEKEKGGGSSSCYVDKSKLKKGYIKSTSRPPDKKDYKERSKNDKEIILDVSNSSSESEFSTEVIKKSKNNDRKELSEKDKKSTKNVAVKLSKKYNLGYRSTVESKRRGRSKTRDSSESSSSWSGRELPVQKSRDQIKKTGSRMEMQRGRAVYKSNRNEYRPKTTSKEYSRSKKRTRDSSYSNSSSGSGDEVSPGRKSKHIVHKKPAVKEYPNKKVTRDAAKPKEKQGILALERELKRFSKERGKSPDSSGSRSGNKVSPDRKLKHLVHKRPPVKAYPNKKVTRDAVKPKEKPRPGSLERELKRLSKDREKSSDSSGSKSVEEVSPDRKSHAVVHKKTAVKEYPNKEVTRNAAKPIFGSLERELKRLSKDREKSSDSKSGDEVSPGRKSKHIVHKKPAVKEYPNKKVTRDASKPKEKQSVLALERELKRFSKEREKSSDSSDSKSGNEVSPDRKSKHLVHKRPAVKEYPNKKVTRDAVKPKEKPIFGSLERELKRLSKERGKSSDSSDSKIKVPADRDRKSKMSDRKMGVDKEVSKKKNIKSIVTAKGSFIPKLRVSIDRKRYESSSDHEERKKKESSDSENKGSPRRKISDLSRKDSSKNVESSGKSIHTSGKSIQSPGKSIQSSGKSKESNNAKSKPTGKEKLQIQREKSTLLQSSSVGSLDKTLQDYLSKDHEKKTTAVENVPENIESEKVNFVALKSALDNISVLMKGNDQSEGNKAKNLEGKSLSRSCESPPKESNALNNVEAVDNPLKTTVRTEMQEVGDSYLKNYEKTDGKNAKKSGSSSESSESDSSQSSISRCSTQLIGIRNAENDESVMKTQLNLAALDSLVSHISRRNQSRRKDKKRGISESSSSSSSSSNSSSDSSSSSSGSSSSGSSSKGSSKSSVSKTRSSSSSSSSSAARQPKRITKSKEHVKRRSRSPLVKRRKRSRTPPPKKIHIGHLTRNINKDHLKEIFGLYGNIKHVDLPMDRGINPRGFAYVEFDNAESAEEAVRHMNGALVDGQKVTVATVLLYKPRPLRRISPMRRPFINWRYTPPFRNRGGGPLSSGGGPRDRRRRMRSPFWRRSPRRRTRSRSPIRRRRMWRTSRSSSR